jgi:RimJ/RimL family protein N-acetyltransferase
VAGGEAAERIEQPTWADGTGVATWPLEAEDLELAASWLADEANAQWLDFGPGVRSLTPPMLRMMTKRDHHCIWVYGPPGDRTPAGLVGLSQIQPDFRAAEIWYVLGDKKHARKGLTYGAVCRMLEHAFGPLGLHCIHAWTVEANVPSRRVLEKAGFRAAGRIRDRHHIGDVAHDRLWFDLLASESELANP